VEGGGKSNDVVCPMIAPIEIDSVDLRMSRFPSGNLGHVALRCGDCCGVRIVGKVE